MKRWIIAIGAVLCCFLSLHAGAEEPEIARLTESWTEDGTVWATVPALASALGARELRREGERVTAVFADGAVTASPGEEWICEGEREYYVPGGVREQNGVPAVPAEIFCRASGYRALFGEEGAILLWRRPKPRWTETDLYWLSRIVWAEARGESFAGQLAVAEVVLNRTQCPWYPDTVEGVIFDTENGVQFSPVLDGSIYNDANESCIHAARIALTGSRTVPNETLFFVAEDLWDSWVGRNREFLFALGGSLFFA